MPRLSRLVTAVTMALALSGSCVARADDRAGDAGSPGEHEAVWTIDARAGYASSWTTGVSHLGVGEGLALGHTWASKLHLELQGLHFQGQEVSAGNATITYRAEYSSTQVQAGFGYGLALGRLLVRPYVQSGLSFVDGHTTVGTAKLRDEITRWMVGPSVAVLVRVSRFVVGVDGQAFFVLTTVAAPSLGVFGVFGIEL